jgi:hypothetical protein
VFRIDECFRDSGCLIDETGRWETKNAGYTGVARGARGSRVLRH